jgi:hypothetical protein
MDRMLGYEEKELQLPRNTIATTTKGKEKRPMTCTKLVHPTKTSTPTYSINELVRVNRQPPWFSRSSSRHELQPLGGLCGTPPTPNGGVVPGRGLLCAIIAPTRGTGRVVPKLASSLGRPRSEGRLHKLDKRYSRLDMNNTCTRNRTRTRKSCSGRRAHRLLEGFDLRPRISRIYLADT